jgi:hypothetical protein
MQSVELSTIPELFQKGSLFQDLSGSSVPNFENNSNNIEGVVENTTLSFPIQYCHFNLSNLVATYDVCVLLSTLRYWVVNEIPVELLVYLLESPMSPETMSLLAEEHREGDSFAFLADLPSFRNDMNADQRLEYAADHGFLALLATLHHFYSSQHQVHLSSSVVSNVAAKAGHLECLRYLCEQGYALEGCCSAATKGGNLNCLMYARDHGCPWDIVTTNLAAEAGHLDCLQYAHENGCPWDDAKSS